MRSEYYQFLLPVKEVALEGIKQYKLCLDTLEERITALLSIADDLSSGTMIIFCNKKDEAKHIFEIFTGNQFPAQLLHGELEQETRQKIMADFRAGNIRQLIATDLIGRGIDVQHVSVVINFGIPNSRDDYIHRIGRSGRFGKKGYAINILSPNDNILLQQYEEHFNFKCDQLPGQIATLLDS
ncbi:MAG: Eukaryotic initiation factor 4A-II [Marteilia pararefringens]